MVFFSKSNFFGSNWNNFRLAKIIRKFVLLMEEFIIFVGKDRSVLMRFFKA